MPYLILIGSGRRSLSAARLTTPPHGGRIGRQAGKAKTSDPDFKTPATNLYGVNSTSLAVLTVQWHAVPHSDRLGALIFVSRKADHAPHGGALAVRPARQRTVKQPYFAPQLQTPVTFPFLDRFSIFLRVEMDKTITSTTTLAS